MHPLPPALQREARTPLRRLLQPLRDLSKDSPRGAVLLLVATATAFALANSPWGPAWDRLWSTPIHVQVGGWTVGHSLVEWVNDGLMAVFFFVIGLEIKREVVHGELSSLRRAALPCVAALGGMVVPAALFLALNAGGPGASGWGVPVATDIAFALGALALVGDRVPISLKVFLTALAIVDDLGAIAVIGLFYGGELKLVPLLVGCGALAVSVAANLAQVRRPLAYFVIGLVVWTGFLESGIHATLAAVLMAFTVPAAPITPTGRPLVQRLAALQAYLAEVAAGREARIPDEEQLAVLDVMEDEIERAQPPLQKLERRMAPYVTLLVLPVFALANAGVRIEGAGAMLLDPVCLGVVIGLVLGKPLGITALSWLAVRAGLARLPAGVTWSQVVAVSVLAGIGFTMSLFIAGLAFEDPALGAAAKAGVLGASLVAGVVGLGLVRRATAPRGELRAAPAGA
jgi:NhaA family Na+:H+ antiporter